MSSVVSTQYIFLALETTGFDERRDEILDISANGQNCAEGRGTINFRRYIVPVKETEFPDATAKNDISLREGTLCYRENPVPEGEVAPCTNDAIVDFFAWVDVNYGKRFDVVLVAHNMNAFHFKFLKKAVCNYFYHVRQASLPENWYDQNRLKFADTLPSFKKMHPGLESYKLPDLAKRYLGPSQLAEVENHEVVNKAEMLKIVCQAGIEKVLHKRGSEALVKFISSSSSFGWERRMRAKKSKHVFFNLATTGVDEIDDEIMEIVATGPKARATVTFQRYIMPMKKTEFPDATASNGLSIQDGVLCHLEKPVPEGEIASSINEAIVDFFAWIKEHYETKFDIVLVAHEARSFHSKFLNQAIRSYFSDARNMSFPTKCYNHNRLRFIDTLPLFEKKCKGRDSYKLPDLAEHFLQPAQNQEAVNKAEVLKMVCKAAGKMLGMKGVDAFVSCGSPFGWKKVSMSAKGHNECKK